MKPLHYLCLASLLISSSLWAQAKPIAPSEEKNGLSKEDHYLQAFGWLLGQQSGIQDLGLTEAEVKQVQIGFAQQALNQPFDVNLKQTGPEIQQFLQKKADTQQKKVQAQNEKIAQENRVQGDRFFNDLKTKNKQNQQFTVLPNGVCYEVLVAGTSKKPTSKDTVKVHYKGMLLDGTVFDRSEPAQEGVVFALSAVIPGFAQGIEGIGEGGRVKVYIPADLAYGDRAVGTIPAGSSLIFEVELIEINPAVFDRLGDAVPTAAS